MRATITAAAMSRAIEAVKAGVARVTIHPDGRTVLERAAEPREDVEEGPTGTQPIDLVAWKKPSR